MKDPCCEQVEAGINCQEEPNRIVFQGLGKDKKLFRSFTLEKNLLKVYSQHSFGITIVEYQKSIDG